MSKLFQDDDQRPIQEMKVVRDKQIGDSFSNLNFVIASIGDGYLMIGLL